MLGARRVLPAASADEDEVAAHVVARLGYRAVVSASATRSSTCRWPRPGGPGRHDGAGADTVLTLGAARLPGFGKAVAPEQDVRLAAVPTTYAGSEMTPIWGLTRGDEKRTGVDRRVKPALVVYDPELTLTLPPAIAGRRA